MTIRQPELADHDAWMHTRRSLWPDCDEQTCRAEMTTISADDDQLALLVFDAAGVAIGFAEFSIHPHAPGCRTTRIGYIEGWWVDAAHRRRGIGAALIAAGEEWARAKGCREMASDTWTNNGVSHDAHVALGYEETDRLIHYRKEMTPGNTPPD